MRQWLRNVRLVAHDVGRERNNAVLAFQLLEGLRRAERDILLNAGASGFGRYVSARAKRPLIALSAHSSCKNIYPGHEDDGRVEAR